MYELPVFIKCMLCGLFEDCLRTSSQLKVHVSYYGYLNKYICQFYSYWCLFVCYEIYMLMSVCLLQKIYNLVDVYLFVYADIRLFVTKKKYLQIICSFWGEMYELPVFIKCILCGIFEDCLRTSSQLKVHVSSYGYSNKYICQFYSYWCLFVCYEIYMLMSVCLLQKIYI